MYESYWKLAEKPFEGGADPRFYFPAETHQAALLKLRYAIENRRSGSLLVGPAGVGKTLLTNILHKTLGEQFQPFIHLVFPRMSPAELLAYLAGELVGKAANGDGHALTPGVDQSLRRIQAFLAENVKRGRHAILIVEEAHLLGDASSLETFRLLMNFESEGRPCLTLLLSGQPGIIPILQRTPQLDERLAVKCLLRPLRLEETSGYVAHRLKIAGAQPSIIPQKAISTLHTLSRGIPRQINRLCDLALLVGFAEEQQTLSPAHFEAVAEELAGIVPE
jgi:general secretion pathway protein A